MQRKSTQLLLCLTIFQLMLFLGFGQFSISAKADESSLSVWEGIDYSAVYDYDFYIRRYTDVRTAFKGNPQAALQHFVVYGMNEGRQACASFNVHSYKNLYPDLRLAFRQDLKAYFLHYIHHGRAEGRLATGVGSLKNPITSYQGIDYSKVYNFYYYTNRYPDIVKAFGEDDIKVLEHFIKFGMKEGRRASENFDVRSYKNAYPDLRRAFGNDLELYYRHFIQFGSKEGRPLTTGVAVVQHGNTIYEGVDYSRVYNSNFYLSRYTDLRNAFASDEEAALKHFVTFGMKEGRQASAGFKVQQYISDNENLREFYGESLPYYYIHYALENSNPNLYYLEEAFFLVGEDRQVKIGANQKLTESAGTLATGTGNSLANGEFMIPESKMRACMGPNWHFTENGHNYYIWSAGMIEWYHDRGYPCYPTMDTAPFNEVLGGKNLYTPRPGDLIYYQTASTFNRNRITYSWEHVGIIVSVGTNQMVTVEGNLEDKLGEERITFDNYKSVSKRRFPYSWVVNVFGDNDALRYSFVETVLKDRALAIHNEANNERGFDTWIETKSYGSEGRNDVIVTDYFSAGGMAWCQAYVNYTMIRTPYAVV